MSKILIVGLGNIGAEYAGTRHNIGFDIADALVAKLNGQYRSDRLADVAELRWKSKQLWIIKPTTYMNLSGKALKYWMEKEKISLDQVLVLVDDLALPLSVIRLRSSGSAAGHNGLTNIQELIGTDQYPRLRFGIGNDYPKGRQIDFVLGRWQLEEAPLVKLKIDKSLEIIESFVFRGIGRTMTDWNKIDFKI
jgi:PTH1 family peptidyl-tRNA hydrolase